MRISTRRLLGFVLMALAVLLLGPVWLLPFFLPSTLLGALLSFYASFLVMVLFGYGAWLLT